MKIKRYVVLRKRRFFVLGKNDAFTEIGNFGIRSKSLSLAGHTFNVLRLLAGHLMRSETSRFSRETFRFSWNLSCLAETFRFSRDYSFLAKLLGFLFLLMAGHTHLMCRNLWPATWWNKCLFGFLVSLFVARKTTRFSLKPFVSRNDSSLFPHELWPAILAYKLPSPFIK